MRIGRLGLAALGLAAAACSGPAPVAPPPPPAPTYVGSAACASCHATEHTAWLDSHHAAAMQPAGEGSVLGDFSGAVFTEGGVTSTFTRREGRYLVRTDAPGGGLAEFEVEYVFGLTPLQQYLIALPGGRLQALGIAWDARPREDGGQRWFHLYPGENLRPGDPLHWTGYLQNWNSMCADCHSTDVRKRYDHASRSFDTTYSEVSVGCEACHGPASNHLAWAADERPVEGEAGDRGLTARLDERRDVAWGIDPATGKPIRSRARDSSREIEVCARCHARRSQLTDDVRAGDSLHDGFRVALLEPRLYAPDGQMREEVYTHGPFLQSRMHAEGVTCSDCHDPHSGGFWAPGDATCLMCHQGEVYAAERHHFHPESSAGARCVSCHMPEVTYMGVDVRHDHAFRIPRPDLAARIGAPDTCTSCHADRDTAWAAAEIARRYPQPAPPWQRFGEAFAALERSLPGAAAEVAALADDAGQPDIVRASAWERLAATDAGLDLAALARAVADPSPLVRAAAAGAIEGAPEEIRARLLGPRLLDPELSVRLAAASALADGTDAGLPDGALASAISEYEQAQLFNAEHPGALVNLGTMAARRGRLDEAVRLLEEARALDRSFLPAHVNLADIHRQRGDEKEAERVLTEALAHAGAAGGAHHALGLCLVRQGRKGEALALLAEAARREPAQARFALVHAVALHDQGREREAIAELERARAIHPASPDLAGALAAYREIRTSR
jgi:Flp pilus assembly protein TadD